MIGSGIFIVSADMARRSAAPAGCWWRGSSPASLTVVAALFYGELAAMMPRAGGQYVYLREAFSPLWGFLYGWTLFLVIQTGTIAAVAVALRPVSRRPRAGDLRDRWIVATDRPLGADTPCQPLDPATRRRSSLIVAPDAAPTRAGSTRQARPERLHHPPRRCARRTHRASACCSGGTPRPSATNFRGLWTPRGVSGHPPDLSFLPPASVGVRTLRRASASPRSARSSRPTPGTTSRSRPAR